MSAASWTHGVALRVFTVSEKSHLKKLWMPLKITACLYDCSLYGFCLSQQFSSGVICGHSCASGTNKFSYSSGVFKGSYYVIAHCLQPDAGLTSAILAVIFEMNRNFP